MRTLISALRFKPGETYGADVYFKALLSALDVSHAGPRIVVAGSKATADWVRSFCTRLETHAVKVPTSALGLVAIEAREAPRLIAHTGADLAFFPFNLMPAVRIPSVLMVHDLVNEFYARELPGCDRIRSRLTGYLVRKSLARPTRIVTPSNAVAEEIIGLTGIDRARIHVVPEAAVTTQPSIAPRPSGKRLMILQTNNGRPHKNARAGILGITALADQDLRLFSRCELVLTGVTGNQARELQALAEKQNVANRVTLHDRLPRTELESLVANASVFLFPSLYEGFGLGLAEAQAAGKAVVASDIPVFREVSGGVAEFFDPLNPKSLAAAIKHVLSDDAHRARLERAGKEHAGRWTWGQHAQALLQVFESTARASAAVARRAAA